MESRTAPPWAAPYWAVTAVLIGFGVAGILVGTPLLVAGLVLLAVGLASSSLRNRSALGAVVGLVFVAICLTVAYFTQSPDAGSRFPDLL